MNTNDIARGTMMVAAAVSMLLSQGCGGYEEKPAAKTAAIKCLGANECKGMSECAGGSGMSSCKGLNQCQGKGWVYTETEAICKEKGGQPQA